MEGFVSHLAGLEEILQNWSSNPGVTGQQLKSVSSEISSSLEEINPEDVPSVVKHLVGAPGNSVTPDQSCQRSLLHIAKSLSKEKEAADFLRDVCEIFTCLMELHPELFEHKLLELFSFCKSLYFVNPSAKARVASLSFLDVIFDCQAGSAWAAKYDVAMLANQFRKQLSLSSKNSSTVLSQLRQVLGKMCQQFPVEMEVHCQDLLVSFVREIQAALKSATEKLDLTLLTGNIRGMSGILMAQGIDADDAEMLESVYDILRKVCRKPEEEDGSVTRRGAMRAALEVFAAHNPLFTKFLLTDFKYWFNLLKPWVRSSNKDDYKVGWKALNSFLDNMGAAIEDLEDIKAEMPISLKFFIGEFKNILLNQGSSHKNISLAIQGYGKFAGALKKNLQEKDYLYVCQEVLHRTEQLYLHSSQKEREAWLLQLPSHLQSCSLLVGQLSSPSSSLFSILERLVVLLVDQFPHIPAQYQGFAVSAVLLSLKTCRTHVEGSLMEQVVYQAVIRSCSHPAVGPLEEVEYGVVTYKSYLPLWSGLVKVQPQGSQFGSTDLSEDIYTEFVKNIFTIIDKLDLTTTSVGEATGTNNTTNDDTAMDVDLTLSQTQASVSDTEDFTATDYYGFQKKARQAKDYTVLVNLVDICAHVLPLNNSVYQLYSSKLWYSTSLWCAEFPEVSSFYKLANILLGLEDIEKVFQDQDDKKQIIVKFLSEVVKRCLSFQDELQLSCFTLVLNIPPPIVEKLVEELSPVLELLLHLGSSMLNLAEKALIAILEWLEVLGQEKLDVLLRRIIPQLRVFLATDFETSSEELTEMKKEKIKRGPLRIDKDKLKKMKIIEKQSGVKVCKLILNLLAQVSTNYKALIFPTEEEVGTAVTTWDMKKHLRVEIPLPDMMLSIYLDGLLPIAVELVQEAPNRKTRVAAGELLHVLVIFMIGRTSQQSDDMAAKSPMTALFSKLFPVLLKLSTDSDSVLQTLYKPLFSQTIHWFTKNRNFETPETSCLLECLINTICNTKDSSLKYQSAKYLQEFLQWSIKQSGSGTKTHNTKSIMKRLYYLWQHPDASKRLGACIAFNSFCRVFREEKPLVSEFLLEAFASAMTCLKLSHSDSEHLGTLEAAMETNNHIKKILLHYHAMFAKDSSERRVPNEMKGGTIKDVQVWLFKMASATQTEVRHKAMETFFELNKIARIPCQEIVTTNYSGIPQYLRSVESQPGLDNLTTSTSLGQLTGWCQSLQAVLECYSWLVGMRLLPSEEVAKGQKKVIQYINFFLSHIATTEVDEMYLTSPVVPADLSKFLKVKCTTIVRLFEFITTFLQSKDAALIQIVASIDQTKLAVSLMKSALESSKVGFHLRTNEEMEQFERCYIEVFAALRAAIPDFHSKLQLFLNKAYLGSDQFSINHMLSEVVKGNEVNDNILKGYISFIQNSLFKVEFDEVDTFEVLLESHIKMHKVRKISNQASSVSDSMGLMMQMIVLKSPTAARIQDVIIATICEESREHRSFVLKYRKALSQLLLSNLSPIMNNVLQAKKSPKLFLRLGELSIKLIKEAKDEKLVKQSASALGKVTLTNWMTICEAFPILQEGSILQLLYYLKQVASICPNFSEESGPEVLSWWCEILQSPKIRLKVKHRALALLLSMEKTASLNEELTLKLKRCLMDFSSQHFPLKSFELKEGSLELNEYTSIFGVFLMALEERASPVIFYLILSVACREEEHVCETEIQDSIFKMMNKNSTDVQVRILNAAWEIFDESCGEFSSSIKLSTVSRFLLPALLAAGSHVNFVFFKEKLERLLKIVGETLRGSDEMKLKTLTFKCGSFMLFGALYSKMDQAQVHSKGSELTSLAADVLRISNLFPQGKGDGKEMSSFLVKSISESRSETFQEGSNEDLRKLYRMFHCASLNCMISVISCIQNIEKLYNHFIFKDGSIWSRIVDTENEIKFEMEQEQLKNRRRQLVTIRQTGQDSTVSANSYIQSHYLSDSSLSQDIGHYDFTSSLNEGLSDAAITARVNEQLSTITSHFMELEGDELGSHPCMAQLISVVRHMQGKQMYPVPTERFTEADPPLWMKSILSVLQSEEAHRNVKLFILKLILSCPEIFTPFSKTFLVPILTLIGAGSLTGSEVVNYFISDLLIMLLSWSNQTGVIPDGNEMEKMSVVRVLSFLMRNIHHDRRDIFRHNLELLRSVLEIWKPCMVGRVDFDILERLFSSSHQGEESSGVQVLAALLVNEMIDPEKLTDQKMALSLISRLDNKYRKVFQAAAETCGMLLKLMKNKESFFDGLKSSIWRKLEKLNNSKAADDKNRFLEILYFIHRHYPDCVKDFSQGFQYTLKFKSGILLTQCLEMLLAKTAAFLEYPENLGSELKMIGLQTYLSKSNSADQKISLQILGNVIESMDSDLKREYLEFIKDLVFHRDTEVRKLVFSLFSKQYTNTSDEHIKRLSLSSLMVGLNDKDPSIQQSTTDFLTSSDLLPRDSFDHIKELLTNLYHPDHENTLVSHIPVSLLSTCSKTPGYTKKIFSDPLDQCKFQEQAVNTSWRQQHVTTMLPMFADTLASQTQATLASQASQMTGVLRATQISSLEFAPTQGASVALGFDATSSLSQYSGSALLFSSKSSNLSNNFSNGSQSQGTSSLELGNLKIGKRFFKAQKEAEHQTKVFSKIAAREKVRAKQLEKDKLATMEGSVKLTRQYRVGDLPDIQISYSDLIAPLSKLCQVNKEFSEVVLVLLANSVIMETQEMLQDGTMIEAINTMFSNILRNSDANSKNFLSAIFSIILSLPEEAKIDSENIVSLCNKADLGSLGVMIMEKFLLADQSKTHSRPTKRQKANEGDDGQIKLWIELSDMYRQVGEYESVRGVHSKGISTHSQTEVALNHEGNGNYGEAQKVYQQLITNQDLIENHLQQEVELWKKGYYESYQKLGQWDKLAKQVETDLNGDLSNVWNPSFTNTLLGPLMESHTHQILDEPDQPNSIFGFLNKSFGDRSKMSILKKHHILQVASLLACKGKHAEALSHISRAIETWRIDTFDQSILGTRDAGKLHHLQALVELENYLICETSVVKTTRGKEKLWKKSFPLQDDELKAWDDILSLRRLYLRETSSKMEVDDVYSPNGETSKLSSVLADNYTKLCGAALNQNNYAVTLRTLKIMQPLIVDQRLKEEHDSLYLDAVMLKAKKDSALNPSDKFCMLFRRFNKFETTYGNDSSQFATTKIKLFENLYAFTKEDANLQPSRILAQLQYDTDKNKFKSIFGAGNDHNLLISCLEKQILGAHEMMINRGKDLGVEFLNLANFCFNIQKENEDSADYSEIIIKNHLLAMQVGNREAQKLFPRILRVIEKVPESGNIFATSITKVPTWMFLPWVNQLVGSLHNDKISLIVVELVERLAREYPRAVVYPYRTSYEKMEDLSDQAIQFKEKLDQLLKLNDVENNIIKNFAFISVPHIASKDMLKVPGHFKEWYPKNFQTLIKAEFEKFQLTYAKPDPHHGTFFQKFVKEFGAKFEKGFQTLTGLSGLNDELEASLRKVGHKLPTMLKDYSAFLGSFQSSDYQDSVEIPGQYSGWSRPIPEHHIQISTFEPTVLPFVSLRKPIRIGVIGSDGKTYRFIIKAGEDLRQDQRIEQLFQICNDRLDQNPACRARLGMKMKTYQVIPLSGGLGMIEFVPKTVPLKNFLNSVEGAEVSIGRANQKYVNGLVQLTGQKNPQQALLASWRHDENKITANFHSAVNQIDKFILKKALQNLSSSSEGFFILRKNFIQSYAVICAMQWVLGIGDRHLSNYMVDQTTGRMVTIDFGYSFGVATSFLPIPELVSLRLTPQIVGVMEPIGTAGLFRESLVQVIISLRTNPEVLVAALEIFVHEPTVDWLETAMKAAKMQKIGLEDSLENFPRQRVDMALSKLRGGNPAAIMVEELKCGVGAGRQGWEPQALRRTVSFIEAGRVGGPGNRQGGRWGRDGLTAGEQVDCLIDQATDNNLLGRMFFGWSPVS